MLDAESIGGNSQSHPCKHTRMQLYTQVVALEPIRLNHVCKVKHLYKCLVDLGLTRDAQSQEKGNSMMPVLQVGTEADRLSDLSKLSKEVCGRTRNSIL